MTTGSRGNAVVPISYSPKKHQMSIALPPALHANLEAAAKRAGHSLGEEIRQRVQRTFQQEEASDATTRELADEIIATINDVHAVAKGGTWHSHSEVHRAAIEAVKTFLEGLAPREVVTENDLGFLGADDPGTIGRTIARQRLRARSRASAR
jgi:hypothetical protein